MGKAFLLSAIMADAGRCDYETDIRPKSESPVSLVRVATYLHQMSITLKMIDDAKAKGYEVSCNIMAISAVQEAELRDALVSLAKSPVDTVYIVDSFGALYPDDTKRLMDAYRDSIAYEINGFSPVLGRVFREAKISYPDGGHVVLTLHDNCFARDGEERLLKGLTSIFEERCGVPAEFSVDYTEEKTKHIRRMRFRERFSSGRGR